MPSLSCGLTNISEIMICCIKIRSMLWWRYIIHKAKIALKLLLNDHRQGRVQPLITVSAVVGALWVKLEPFFGWRCHIIPVVTPLLYPARTLLEPPSSFPFVCCLTSCCCIFSHALFQLIFLFSLLFCSSLSALSQHTSLSAQNGTPLSLLLSYFMFYPSIHPSIHHPHHHSLALFLSLSLVSLCCGLCLPSLSELLSLLSAPLARTKSSSAHGTTKDERNKRKEPQPKKRRRKGGKIKKEGSKLEGKEGARNTSFHVNHDALSSVGYNNHWFLPLSFLLSIQHRAYSWLEVTRAISIHIKCLFLIL